MVLMLIKLGMAGGSIAMLISSLTAALPDTQVGADDTVRQA